ncbi:MAG TPA: ATP-binding cassette domain-containing protein [Vitreimonas sp.]|uniref:ABC transporter ATP-binding protein n=1 Tax=Vitreimonas sp. TaxID=3069702 RepID=UPI002D3191C4|nr:ATP-binding cassette domain-containing protein [Vitreimonas sp.]HYD87725.1 ATP-binding cassette domain-containing protein [Vitreimonas sp.]
MAHIELTDVEVEYPVYSSGRQRSILTFAAHRASFGKVAREAGQIPTVAALNGISFELKEGDRLALMGRNGSGKSTLLKVCAGLILPDRGKVDIRGSRASILTLGSSLDPDKSGIENVHMIGQLLGVSGKERKLLLEDVADFTELSDFLHLPVRTYSSGMTVRLLFALATSVERDILIVDEVIGAGDAHFVEKAAKRVRAMFERAKILVLATHSGEIATQLCNQALWVHGGRPMMTGAPDAVWDAYINQRPPLEAVA